MLVERRREIEILRDVFTDCAGGRGRVALISGGLASGKTELLHAFCERIADTDPLLLTASAARAEQSMRMGVVWQLFHSPDVPPQIVDRISRLISLDSLVDEAETAAEQPVDARTVHGIGGVLLELADERPVVIAVDDVHFADTASLEVLRYVRCRMRSAKLLMVLTEWERPSMARPPLRAELTRQPHRRIALAPLSEAGVAELISRQLGQDAAARLARDCFALGGGNPFLTHALIEDQSRRDVLPPAGLDELAVGPAFREAVLDCLHRWEPEFVRVAGGMAVLGEHATPELVGELVGVQPQAVAQVFAALTTAGLVQGGRLRHAEIDATVLESLSSRDRSTLHGRAAELLYRNGVDAVQVARQVTAVDSVPGSWAVPLLRHAAEQSLAEDAGLAVRYLELAIRTTDDERALVALHAAAVRAAWRVKPSAAALHLAPLHDALRAGELTWRDALPVIRQLLWQGELDEAAEQLQAVHASAGPADTRTAAELRLAGEWIYGRLLDRVPDDVRAWLAAGEGNPSAYPWRRTAVLNTLWTGEDTDVVNAAEHVLQSCLGDVVPEVAATAILALDYAGRHKRAKYWCETLFEEAQRQNATTWQAVFGCVRAEIAWRRGDLTTAHEQATTALGLLNTQSWGVLIGLPLSVLILVNTALGRHDAAAELLDRAVPEAMFDTVLGLRYLHASGHYHLACGRPLAAIDDFERCGAAMRRWGFDLPAMVPWRGDLAQAYLQLGMRREARALVVEQLGRPGAMVGPRARAIALRTLAGCAEPPERVRILREAVQILERCASRLDLAHTLTDLSQAYRELGDLGNAQLVLRRADQIAKACLQGSGTAGQPARRGPEVPARRPGERAASAIGVSALSGAEQKVAELAANGHSNREIGRKLSITVSTVEQHLTRVYRKLNVSRRTDLLSELSRHDAIERAPLADESRVLVPR